MDVEFIEQLALQIQKYIFARSRPQKNKSTPTNTNKPSFSNNSTISIYPMSHYSPTSIPEIHDWIRTAKLTSHPLSESDVEALVQRLVYDGVIYKVDGEDYYVSSRASLSGYNQVSALVDKSRGYSDSPCGIIRDCGWFDWLIL